MAADVVAGPSARGSRHRVQAEDGVRDRVGGVDRERQRVAGRHRKRDVPDQVDREGGRQRGVHQPPGEPGVRVQPDDRVGGRADQPADPVLVGGVLGHRELLAGRDRHPVQRGVADRGGQPEELVGEPVELGELGGHEVRVPLAHHAGELVGQVLADQIGLPRHHVQVDATPLDDRLAEHPGLLAVAGARHGDRASGDEREAVRDGENAGRDQLRDRSEPGEPRPGGQHPDTDREVDAEPLAQLLAQLAELARGGVGIPLGVVHIGPDLVHPLAAVGPTGLGAGDHVDLLGGHDRLGGVVHAEQGGVVGRTQAVTLLPPQRELGEALAEHDLGVERDQPQRPPPQPQRVLAQDDLGVDGPVPADERLHLLVLGPVLRTVRGDMSVGVARRDPARGLLLGDPVEDELLAVLRQRIEEARPLARGDLVERPLLAATAGVAEHPGGVAVQHELDGSLPARLGLDLLEKRRHVVVVPLVVVERRRLDRVRAPQEPRRVIQHQLDEPLARRRAGLDVLGQVVPRDVEVDLFLGELAQDPVDDVEVGVGERRPLADPEVREHHVGPRVLLQQTDQRHQVALIGLPRLVEAVDAQPGQPGIVVDDHHLAGLLRGPEELHGVGAVHLQLAGLGPVDLRRGAGQALCLPGQRQLLQQLLQLVPVVVEPLEQRDRVQAGTATVGREHVDEVRRHLREVRVADVVLTQQALDVPGRVDQLARVRQVVRVEHVRGLATQQAGHPFLREGGLGHGVGQVRMRDQHRVQVAASAGDVHPGTGDARDGPPAQVRVLRPQVAHTVEEPDVGELAVHGQHRHPEGDAEADHADLGVVEGARTRGEDAPPALRDRREDHHALHARGPHVFQLGRDAGVARVGVVVVVQVGVPQQPQRAALLAHQGGGPLLDAQGHQPRRQLVEVPRGDGVRGGAVLARRCGVPVRPGPDPGVGLDELVHDRHPLDRVRLHAARHRGDRLEVDPRGLVDAEVRHAPAGRLGDSALHGLVEAGVRAGRVLTAERVAEHPQRPVHPLARVLERAAAGVHHRVELPGGRHLRVPVRRCRGRAARVDGVRHHRCRQVQ